MKHLSRAELHHLARFATETWLPSPFKQFEANQVAASIVEDSSHHSSGGAIASTTCLFQMKQRVLWTEEEDALLRELVAKYGTTKWSFIASKIPFKTNKHCRRRWQACVNATGNKGVWTVEEDTKLLQGHRLFGNRWTEIAKLVPGRTDNAAKNRFMAIAKKEVAAVSQSAVNVASSESSLSGDAPACSSVIHDVCSFKSCGNKRSSESTWCIKSRQFKKPFLLDLNIEAACNSSSDVSELIQDGEASAESFSNRSPREWLDLNEFPVSFDN